MKVKAKNRVGVTKSWWVKLESKNYLVLTGPNFAEVEEGLFVSVAQSECDERSTSATIQVPQCVKCMVYKGIR